MTALDFFLYDNRTLSPRWGRDWGLKAATGALADRADLKAAFDRYCGAMPGGQGQLRGFGEAIGGVRSPSRDGYLLCVTLESSDSFGRPSWAVFGLWCPDTGTLGDILSSGDPIGSARTLLSGETPPSAIEIRPARVVTGTRRRRASSDPAFYRFDLKSTVPEVIAILLGAVQRRTALPNVLGITATSRLAAVAQAGFNVVYCHPMDDQTERILARVLSPQEPEVKESWPLPAGPTTPSVDHQSPKRITRREPRSSIFPLWFLWVPAGIVAAGILFLVVVDIRPGAPAISRKLSPPLEEQVTDLGDSPVPEVALPEERSTEVLLDEVRERLEECKELDPEELRLSVGFVAAEKIEVLPEYQESRDRVRESFATLFKIRERMVKRQGKYVAYYYDEAGKDAAPATRLQKISEILKEAPLGGEDCAILKDAFGFEFETEDSVVFQWCSSLGRLEKTAKAHLGVASKVAPHGNQKPQASVQ